MKARGLSKSELQTVKAVMESAIQALRPEIEGADHIKEQIQAALKTFEDCMIMVIDREGEEWGAYKLEIKKVNMDRKTVRSHLDLEGGDSSCN